MTATQGAIYLQSVTAPKGKATITAQGSILDGNAGGVGLDVAAVDLVLSSTRGSIGTAQAPLTLAASGQVSADAA